jgi:hypothetical protein
MMLTDEKADVTGGVKTERYRIALRVILVLVGIVGVLFATQRGVGTSEDSLIYIGAARSLLSGYGLSYQSDFGVRIPLDDFPPLFPITVAAIGLFGVDPLVAARWGNSLLFGANILLVGFVIERYARKPTWMPVFGSLLMLTSVDMLYIHSMAWSEPTFIFFALLGMLLLEEYFEHRRWRVLVAASGAMALAFFTRYVGVVLVATGIVGIMLRTRESWLRKTTEGAVFALVSCSLIGLWSIRNLLVIGHMTDRTMAIHPITADQITPALETFRRWVLPTEAKTLGLFRDVAMPLIVGMAILWAILLVVSRLRLKESDYTDETVSEIPVLLGGFLLIYVVFLLSWVSVYDASPVLGVRYLSPLYVCVVILVSCLVLRVMRGTQVTRSLRLTCVSLSLAVAAGYTALGTSWVITSYQSGLGYAREIWQNSPILQKVKTLPLNIRVYTNATAPIRLYDPDRSSLRIPSKFDAQTLAINKRYSSQIERIYPELKGGTAVLVWFNRRPERYLPTEEELKTRLHLVAIERAADGTVYSGSED